MKKNWLCTLLLLVVCGIPACDRADSRESLEVGPPFIPRADGRPGYEGVDWSALSRENVNAHYVFSSKGIVGQETDYPLIIAVEENSPEHVRLCIELGADLGARKIETEASQETRMSALHIAARRGYVEIVRMLVEAGADMERRRWQDSMTPLMMAAEHGHVETVRYLLEAGANPARRCSDPGKDSDFGCTRLEFPDTPPYNDSEPDTALEFAERNNHPECADLIRKRLDKM